MIIGEVADREAHIEIDVWGTTASPLRVKAVIDTGYNGYLTLPADVTSTLALAFAGHRSGTLADGSTVVLDVYLGAVTWHGQQTDVLVAQAAGMPLIGMTLLHGSRLTIDVIDHGKVIIEGLPRPQ